MEHGALDQPQPGAASPVTTGDPARRRIGDDAQPSSSWQGLGEADAAAPAGLATRPTSPRRWRRDSGAEASNSCSRRARWSTGTALDARRSPTTRRRASAQNGGVADDEERGEEVPRCASQRCAGQPSPASDGGRWRSELHVIEGASHGCNDSTRPSPTVLIAAGSVPIVSGPTRLWSTQAGAARWPWPESARLGSRRGGGVSGRHVMAAASDPRRQGEVVVLPAVLDVLVGGCFVACECVAHRLCR